MHTWLELIPALAVAMARPFGLFLLLPVLSSRLLGGALASNGLVLLLALPALPLLMPLPGIVQTGDVWTIVGMIAREVALGTLLGFFAAMPFWAIDMAGFVLDTVRGSSMASVLNPMLGDQASQMGMLFGQVLAVVFLATGGLNVVLSSLYASYGIIPPAAEIGLAAGLIPLLLKAWRTMWELCLLFAMPAVSAMVLVDVALGFVNRSAQQLNVFFVAMPIKSAIALLLLAVSLPYALVPYREAFETFAQLAVALAGSVR